MPLYEYQCTKCDNRFERIQKFSDPLVTVCPLCGGKVERALSIPAVHFKGTGWYVTDYARKGSQASESNSDSKPATVETKCSGTKSSTTTESKPAEKK